jgi:plasmid stabilization system protein ParE
VSAVVWLPEALVDVDRLHGFLRDQNPDAARRAARIILGGSKQLAALPEIGKPMSDGTGRRELFLPFGSGSYVLRYMLHQNQVVIIRVWHSREDREFVPGAASHD